MMDAEDYFGASTVDFGAVGAGGLSMMEDSLRLDSSGVGGVGVGGSGVGGAGQEGIFKMARLEYKPPAGIVHMAAANNVLAIALQNNHVLRINFEGKDGVEVEDLDLQLKPSVVPGGGPVSVGVSGGTGSGMGGPASSSSGGGVSGGVGGSGASVSSTSLIYRVFLDPTGSHMLITTRTEENLYLHSSFKKAKALPKMKGMVITSIAWDTRNRETNTTQAVLIGTRDGRIVETSFEAVVEKKIAEIMAAVGVGGKEQVLKTLYRVDSGQPITGLRFDKFVGGDAGEVKLMILATTPTRLYQFVGGPTFEQVMSYYEQTMTFQEMPPGRTQAVDGGGAELAFFGKFRGQGGVPSSFAWITGPGVYHGSIASLGMHQPGDFVVQDTAIITYDEATGQQQQDSLSQSSDRKKLCGPPSAVILTEFHYLFLVPSSSVQQQMASPQPPSRSGRMLPEGAKLVAMNSLSEGVVWEWDMTGQPVRGVCQDSTRGTVWVYYEDAILEVVITDEDRDAWRLYLERKDWSRAIEYCREDSSKKDVVFTAQAEHHFSAGQYEIAAGFYARTRAPFEEVALKFISGDRRDALMTYLKNKLESIPPKMKTQLTVITTWLVELYLNKLNLVKEQQDEDQQGYKKGYYQEVQQEFRALLTKYKEHLKASPSTTFNLIASHGRTDDLLYYAEVTEDYERVLSHYIQGRHYVEAVNCLARMSAANEELFYKYSPVLMRELPEDTVDCWLSKGFLQPKRLFPALMRYQPSASGAQMNQAIRYLQSCVDRSAAAGQPQEMAVHNLLLVLYAQQPDELALRHYIESAGAAYDPKYALRICTKLGKWQACVLIYGRMGLYQEAVDMALANGAIVLAKANANAPEDEAVRRRLWLNIAQHVVRETGSDIRQAMDLLRECELLSIEAILPFFPNFTRIDDFKEEITKSLEEYTANIRELKEEMDEATKSAQLIRLDVASLRNRSGVVRTSRACDICHHPLLSRQFYLFPCHHVFHSDCLATEVCQSLPPGEREHVSSLQARLHAAPEVAAPSASSETPFQRAAAAARRALASSSSLDSGAAEYLALTGTEAIKAELDRLIAAECPMCGEAMIRQIDMPFINPDEERDVIAAWDLRSSLQLRHFPS